MTPHPMSDLRLSATLRGTSTGLLLMTVLVGGCAVVPPAPPRPAVLQPADLPPAWGEPAAVSPAARAVEAGWWRAFGSARLVLLVERALSDSADVRIAAERLSQAALTLRQTEASLLPSVSLGAGSTLSRSEASGASASERRSSSLSVAASYEVDLWGRLAAAQRSGQAQLAGSRFDLETARLSVSAAVAEGYVQLLGVQARRVLARDNLRVAERVLAVVQARRRHGTATELEVSQQATTVAQQQAALLPLDLQVRQGRSALAVLLGQPPQVEVLPAGVGETETLADLRVPEVAPGLPAQLLTRRPDLASAEAALAAADADVDAARAALLPSLSLSTSAGLSSSALLSLAQPTRSLALGATLAQSLFDGGQRRVQVDISLSQRTVLVETYAQAVRTALKEVEDGLGQAAQVRRQLVAQQQVVTQAERTLRLAELRYRQGVGDLLTVLEAQRSLFSAQDAQMVLVQSRVSAALTLFKALGGGWSATPSAS